MTSVKAGAQVLIRGRIMSDRRRLSIDLTPEQHDTLKANIPHGMMKIVFHIIVDDLCDMYHKYGEVVNVALMSNALSYKTMIRRHIEQHAIDRSKKTIRPVDC